MGAEVTLSTLQPWKQHRVPYDPETPAIYSAAQKSNNEEQTDNFSE